MVSSRKKKNQQKRQLRQSNETLNNFNIRNNTNVGLSENEKLEQQASGPHTDFERIVDNASQNQVIGNNTDDRKRVAVYSAVIVVENSMHDAKLTAINVLVIPWVKMAVRWITGSSGNGPNSIVQKPDRKDSTGNTKSTALRSASSRLDLNMDQDMKGETRGIDNSEDDNFPATRLDYDRRAHAHHICRLVHLGLKWSTCDLQTFSRRSAKKRKPHSSKNRFLFPIRRPSSLSISAPLQLILLFVDS